MNPNPPAKILIADDEVYMLRLLEMTFKKGGYTVVSCRDGQAALTQAASDLPQLIVLDVMMPGLDGLGALRQLKENPATRGIPVVVLSAVLIIVTVGVVLWLGAPRVWVITESRSGFDFVQRRLGGHLDPALLPDSGTGPRMRARLRRLEAR